jgi:hypothetical protein
VGIAQKPYSKGSIPSVVLKLLYLRKLIIATTLGFLSVGQNTGAIPTVVYVGIGFIDTI